VLDHQLPGGLRLRPGRAVFAEAAFGARPGLAAAELPAAADPAESWLRAIALGGQGRYAAARIELARTCRDTRDPLLRSLATSTAASLWRQLGWHLRAAALDGRALALAADPRAAVPESARAEALCDALIGLAADALGGAGPATAARLLERCRDPLDRLGDGPASRRPRMRWHWVNAETALSSPGGGATALAHAETALALAAAGRSVRHRVKSGLLVAAAAAVAGDPGRAGADAATIDEQCREHGLVPLRWACAMLRSGLETGATAAAAAATARRCARVLAGHGGVLR
jgi:hypothetical protein